MALNVSYSVNRNHDLWQDLKDGNRNALDKIYYENVASMLLYGMQFTRDNALIDDCIQELFIDLWVKRDRLGPTDSIRFYLMKSLKRRILRSLKRAAKHDYFADMDELLMAPESPSADNDRSSQTEALNRSLEQLSATQKEIIFLRFYNDLSFDEIREALGLSKKQLYNAVSKALIRLRKLMITIAFLFILLY